MPVTDYMPSLEKQDFPAASLYVIATPIGNLGDMTFRAVYALSKADAVACEDTRVTSPLLSAFSVKKPLIIADEHHEKQAAQQIIARLGKGERVAFVSDAGTPGISDPGAAVVDEVRKAGFRVIPIPGVSAAVAAMSVTGFTDTRFLFAGFLSPKAGIRKRELESLKATGSSLVFYEAPHRIADMVKALSEVFEPERRIMFARELTKLYEETGVTTVGEALTWLSENKDRSRGEYVVVVEGGQASSGSVDEDRLIAVLAKALNVKTAAEVAAEITGGKKKVFYEKALAIKEAGEA